ncbi:MAG TPA: ABC transporter permease, partial [Pirellulales bacterium]
ANGSEAVEFVARLMATILPNLDHFSIEAAVTTGKPVPLAYVGLAALYCLVYTTAMTFLALLLFEDRDLA